MALRSINPSDGRLVQEYPETDAGAVAGHPARGPRRLPRLAPDDLRRARGPDAARGRAPARAQGRPRPADGPRDGQAPGPGPGRGGEVRLGLRLLRRGARSASCPRRRSRPTPRAATWPSPRSGSCSRSCPGTFPSGRSSASPPPRLMAGNAGVLKHAGNVSGCALAIERIFADAGVAARPLPRAARLLGARRRT